jgi:hypothetical protein
LKMAANEEADACDSWEELEDSGVHTRSIQLLSYSIFIEVDR